jgi:hypothetical protein
MAAFKADLVEKLDTKLDAVAAQQEEKLDTVVAQQEEKLENVMQELRARRGQAADSLTPHLAGRPAPHLSPRSH